MSEQDRPAAEWLAKAADDSGPAQHARTAPQPYVRGMCYHAQQAAEKYLKGFLVARGIGFRKVHDLTYLVEQCAESDQAFMSVYHIAAALDDYSAPIRYPGPDLPPTLDQADSAIARQIRDFVLTRL